MFGHHDAATVTGDQSALPSLWETFLNKCWGAEASQSLDEQAGTDVIPDR